MDNNNKPLEINLRSILSQRLPKRIGRFMPSWAYAGLEKLICQKELNDMLRVGFPKRGSAFAKRILTHLQIKVEIVGLDSLPKGRFMFASNHPLGGLDGIALIAILGEKYGDENVRVLVNDLLMNVEPLRDVFLPINKFGPQGRKAAVEINKAMADENMQIVQFPAGLVSRLHNDGSVSDLEWQKAFVTKAAEYARDIVPIHFQAKNTMKFYKTAKWRKKLGLKFNAEQILLPGEVVKSRGNKFRIIFGKPIPWQTLGSLAPDARNAAAVIRERVYNLR